ncbi:MAG TPA: LysE family translocator [Devosia sp.]|nr:LysE family translocator [Devosia sp.]
MPSIATLIPFVIACYVVCAVPGISVSAMVSTALARGFWGGIWQEMGAQLGRFSVVLLVAVALQAITTLVSAAFDVIKYAGAAYLIYLGVKYLIGHSTLAVEAAAPPSPARQVVAGFFVVWTNPKALIFLGAFLPQFVDPRFPAWPQVIVLGLIEMFAALCTDSIYIALAAFARGAISGKRIVVVNRLAGVILIGAAIWLALQHKA